MLPRGIPGSEAFPELGSHPPSPGPRLCQGGMRETKPWEQQMCAYEQGRNDGSIKLRTAPPTAGFMVQTTGGGTNTER